MKKLLVMVMMVGLIGVGVSYGALLANDGGFENWNSTTDLAYWAEEDHSGGQYPLVVQQESVIKTEGNYSAYTEFQAGSKGYTNIFGYSRGHFVDPAETYVFELDFYPIEEGKQIYVQLWQYDSSGQSVAPPYSIGGGAQGTVNQWNTLSFQFGAGTDKPLDDDVSYVLAKIWCGNWASWKGYIDNARITLVPEPTAISLLSLGIFGLVRRR